MNIEDLLGEFGRETGLAGLTLNENNACRLVFDGQWPVDIECIKDNKVILMHLVVDAPPIEGRDEYFLKLLSANMTYAASGGPVFAFDSSIDEVVLFQRLVLEHTDYLAFSTALELLVNRAEDWYVRLNVHAGAEPTYDSDSEGEEAPIPRDVIWL